VQITFMVFFLKPGGISVFSSGIYCTILGIVVFRIDSNQPDFSRC
jgi:hypothetical protein